MCSGAEDRLADCTYTTSHCRYVAKVRCTLGSYNTTLLYSIVMSNNSADCVDGEVRLSEGETEWKGRLEVCYGERWGTVSSEGWSDANTEVVCNDLGYKAGTGIYT